MPSIGLLSDDCRKAAEAALVEISQAANPHYAANARHAVCEEVERARRMKPTDRLSNATVLISAQTSSPGSSPSRADNSRVISARSDSAADVDA